MYFMLLSILLYVQEEESLEIEQISNTLKGRDKQWRNLIHMLWLKVGGMDKPLLLWKYDRGSLKEKMKNR